MNEMQSWEWLIVLPLAGRMRKKHRCTYEFQFEGEQQTIAIVDHLDLFSRMKVGHQMTIWIDPVYRDEYYIPFDRNDLRFTVHCQQSVQSSRLSPTQEGLLAPPKPPSAGR